MSSVGEVSASPAPPLRQVLILHQDTDSATLLQAAVRNLEFDTLMHDLASFDPSCAMDLEARQQLLQAAHAGTFFLVFMLPCMRQFSRAAFFDSKGRPSTRESVDGGDASRRKRQHADAST